MAQEIQPQKAVAGFFISMADAFQFLKPLAYETFILMLYL